MDSRLILLAAAALGWFLLINEERTSDALRASLSASEQLATERAETISAQRAQLDQLAQVGADLVAFRQALARQGEAQQRQLKELKENDQAAALWLAGSVPAGVGRLFVYPETTDPDAYTPLPVDAVSSAGAVGAGRQ